MSVLSVIHVPHRAKFESLSEKLVLKDLELSMKLDVCSQLWKHGHYPVIEALRKMQGEEVYGYQLYIELTTLDARFPVFVYLLQCLYRQCYFIFPWSSGCMPTLGLSERW